MNQMLHRGDEVGSYIVEDFLGRGAFATVYSARRKRSPRTVALKIGNISGGGCYTPRFL